MCMVCSRVSASVCQLVCHSSNQHMTLLPAAVTRHPLKASHYCCWTFEQCGNLLSASDAHLKVSNRPTCACLACIVLNAGYYVRWGRDGTGREQSLEELDMCAGPGCIMLLPLSDYCIATASCCQRCCTWHATAGTLHESICKHAASFSAFLLLITLRGHAETTGTSHIIMRCQKHIRRVQLWQHLKALMQRLSRHHSIKRPTALQSGKQCDTGKQQAYKSLRHLRSTVCATHRTVCRG